MMPSAGPRSQCAWALEVEDGRVAVPAHLDVVRGLCAHRDALVRQVGQRHQDGVTRLFDVLKPGFPRRDRCRVSLTSHQQLVHRLPVAFRPSDPRSKLLLRTTGLLEHRDDLATRGVQPSQLPHQASEVRASLAEPRFDIRCRVAKQRGVEHGLHSTCPDSGILR